MVRHPLDQAASMAEAIIYPHDPLLAGELLREAHEAADALQKAHPDRVLLLSYEAFMEDPWTTIRRVCDFTGIKPNQHMLDAYKSAKAKAFASRSDLWQANDRAPDPSNIGRGRQRLTRRQIQEIETLLRPTMKLYGYMPETTADIVISEERWAEAREASAAAGQAKWEALAARRPDEYDTRIRRIRYFEACRHELEASGLTQAHLVPS